MCRIRIDLFGGGMISGSALVSGSCLLGIMNYELRMFGLGWDVQHRLLSSVEKAKRLLGYEPQMGFEEGLNRVHAWFYDNWENIERSAEF